MTWIEKHIAARDNLAAIILAQTDAWVAAGCPPSFSVDGESYSWNEWLDGKNAALDTMSKTIQMNAQPFVIRSRVRP